MERCEDYPCCGHGPPPLGDGGGCPDEDGRFRCAGGCGKKMPKDSRSSLCKSCLRRTNDLEEMGIDPHGDEY